MAVKGVRHWKQEFDKHADFVWRKRLKWDKEMTVVGDPIPALLKDNPTKLRRFWESQSIELAGFEAPDVATGRVAEPEEEPEAADYSKMTGKVMDALVADQEIAIEGWDDMKVPEKRIALAEHMTALGDGEPE